MALNTLTNEIMLFFYYYYIKKRYKHIAVTPDFIF